MPTEILWTDETWNVIIGCSHASPGCDNCYAEKMARRLAAMGNENYDKVVAFDSDINSKNDGKYFGWNGNTVFVESALSKPLRWKKPRNIFVCSMADLFHESVPFEWIAKVTDVIRKCPQHTFQILTKRPQRMHDYFCHHMQDHFPPEMQVLPNLWLGVTAENQEQADIRIPILLQIPAALRFLSVEPMLGPVDLQDAYGEMYYCSKCNYVGEMDRRCCIECSDAIDLQCDETDDGDCSKCHQGTMTAACPKCDNYCGHFAGESFAMLECYYEKILPGIDWVIIGAESGPKRRFCEPEWAYNLKDQCKEAGVPCFVKQLHDVITGKIIKAPTGWPREMPEAK